MMNLDDLRREVGSRIPQGPAESLLELARPSIVLATERSDGADLELGESRVGGSPDLPAGLPWPRWNGEPQSFIAQIELSRIGGLPGAKTLPPDGWLAFFYSARQDTWGFDPGDRESWTVVHVPADTPLERRDPLEAMPDGGAFSPCRVAFRSSFTLPPWETPAIERLGLDDSILDAYCDALDALFTGEEHRLLGHADQIQSDMTMECQLVSHGISTGDPGAWTGPEADRLRRDSPHWRLLLQVASDDQAGMMWGDAGYLYYWIREADLARRAFDHTWMILQCH